MSGIISSRPKLPNWPSWVVSSAIAEDDTSNNTNGMPRANILVLSYSLISIPEDYTACRELILSMPLHTTA
jgi:hypothetical protein